MSSTAQVDVKTPVIGKLDENKLRGMLIGVFLGDAMGAPYEFKHNSGDLFTYNGLIHKKASTFNRFATASAASGTKSGNFTYYPLGSMTDDSEMTLVICRSLIANNGYSRELVVKDYMAWANSNQPMMGKNTRELFKGIKTIKGFEARLAKVTKLEENKRSQSNGSLMRCSPLAVLPTFDSVLVDCNLTNPNKVNRDANLIQVMTLWMLLRNIPVDEIWKTVKIKAQTPEVRELLSFVEANRLISSSASTAAAQSNNLSVKLEWSSLAAKGKKGWVLNGLYCSMIALLSLGTYQDVIDWVIKHPGSDTDTNGAIAGAVLGAKLGYELLAAENRTATNIKLIKQPIVQAGDVLRPDKYLIKDFDDLCHGLYRVGTGQPQITKAESKTPMLTLNLSPSLILLPPPTAAGTGQLLALTDNKQVDIPKVSFTGSRVVCLKRTGGKIVQDCDVYIGRRLTQGEWNLADTEC